MRAHACILNAAVGQRQLEANDSPCIEEAVHGVEAASVSPHRAARRASIFLPVKIGSLTWTHTHTPPPSVGGRERRLDPYPPTVSAPNLPYPTQRLSQTLAC